MSSFFEEAERSITSQLRENRTITLSGVACDLVTSRFLDVYDRTPQGCGMFVRSIAERCDLSCQWYDQASTDARRDFVVALWLIVRRISIIQERGLKAGTEVTMVATPTVETPRFTITGHTDQFRILLTGRSDSPGADPLWLHAVLQQ